MIKSNISAGQAIICAALIIAGSIIFVNSIRPAEAQRVGPFQLEHHSNINANAGVFRLDTSTGEVSYCFLPGVTSLDPVCSKTVR